MACGEKAASSMLLRDYHMRRYDSIAMRVISRKAKTQDQMGARQMPLGKGRGIAMSSDSCCAMVIRIFEILSHPVTTSKYAEWLGGENMTNGNPS